MRKANAALEAELQDVRKALAEVQEVNGLLKDNRALLKGNQALLETVEELKAEKNTENVVDDTPIVLDEVVVNHDVKTITHRECPGCKKWITKPNLCKHKSRCPEFQKLPDAENTNANMKRVLDLKTKQILDLEKRLGIAQHEPGVVTDTTKTRSNQPQNDGDVKSTTHRQCPGCKKIITKENITKHIKRCKPYKDLPVKPGDNLKEDIERKNKYLAELQ